MTDCLVCRYEAYATEDEQAAFCDAVLARADADPKAPVVVCDAHFAEMALRAQKLGDLL